LCVEKFLCGFFVLGESKREKKKSLKSHGGRKREGGGGGGGVKGKLANGVGTSTLHTTSEHGVSSITTADSAHLGCQ